MYRLVVDFPLGDNQAEAIVSSKILAQVLELAVRGSALPAEGVKTMQYRLQNDEDRSVKNYLSIDSNGHAGNKKISIEL